MPDPYKALYIFLIGTKERLAWIDGKRCQLLPGCIRWPIDKISGEVWGSRMTEDDEFLMEYGVFKNEE